MSSGSPVLGRKSSAHFTVLDQNPDPRSKASTAPSPLSPSDSPNPLKTSKLGNFQTTAEDKVMRHTAVNTADPSSAAMDNILARLRANDHSGAPRVVSTPAFTRIPPFQTDQQIILKKQKSDLGQRNIPSNDAIQTSQTSSASDVATPVTGSFDLINLESKGGKGLTKADAAEMLRIKKELAEAKSVINRQEKELAHTRTTKHTVDQAFAPTGEYGDSREMADSTIGHLQSAFNATARPFTARNNNTWVSIDARSDNADAFSLESFDRSRPAFAATTQYSYGSSFNQPVPQPSSIGNLGFASPIGTSWGSSFPGQSTFGQPTVGQAPRIFSGPSLGTMGMDGRIGNEPSSFGPPNSYRRSTSNFSRPNPGPGGRTSGFGSLSNQMSNLNMIAPSISPPTFASSMSYQPRPVGADLSPTASEFSIPPFTSASSAAWNPMSNTGGQTYVTPLEPLNYRRLLDKSVTCDWKYIVDKIVCNNDQQASIFLQQKLKVGTAEQKYDIVEAIINQAYPLMVNRFGNFLVQRCFEHGTPDQVVAIANAIHGNVLSLSMDPFGCHVIQKAFDSVPEDHKADMVHELLRRIPDTVIHRYACHVWQKLFELRWNGEPPQIMTKVNEALRGMWHEVALGETGSLVVQNIFENCVEEEKRPAIEEVIANIDLIAHGQFGNWCIQHLCEHAAPADKRRVIDHILTNAYSYSIDQFASKVVEKCLKIGGTEFLDRYLGVITTAHPDRPRIPLIDIAGDQYGNYLIQWILMNSQYHQREQVAIHIRKHMVSLRGSKFGSRVAMLCCNPAQVTRPGPGVVVNPFGAPGQPRGWGRFR